MCGDAHSKNLGKMCFCNETLPNKLLYSFWKEMKINPSGNGGPINPLRPCDPLAKGRESGEDVFR